MWQQLFSDLKDHAFMVVAVAEDSRGEPHVRPWVEQRRVEKVVVVPNRLVNIVTRA